MPNNFCFHLINSSCLFNFCNFQFTNLCKSFLSTIIWKISLSFSLLFTDFVYQSCVFFIKYNGLVSCFFLILERVYVKLDLIIAKTFGRFFPEGLKTIYWSWVFWWVGFLIVDSKSLILIRSLKCSISFGSNFYTNLSMSSQFSY